MDDNRIDMRPIERIKLDISEFSSESTMITVSRNDLLKVVELAEQVPGLKSKIKELEKELFVVKYNQTK